MSPANETTHTARIDTSQTVGRAREIARESDSQTDRQTVANRKQQLPPKIFGIKCHGLSSGGDNRSSAVADTLPRLIKMSELHERLGVSKREKVWKRDGVERQQITKVANKTAFKAFGSLSPNYSSIVIYELVSYT